MNKTKSLPKSVVVLLVISALLLVSWSFIIPIFEGPDEEPHWHYARYLYQYRQLPLYTPDFVEANSPPLYYAIIAPIAVPTKEPPMLIWANGRDSLVMPFPPKTRQTTKEDLYHYWPIRIARLITVVMSVLTVFLCYLAGREITGKQSTGLLAAGFVALLPQFAFRGMNVSNDSLVTTLSALSLYLILCIVKRGFDWKTGVSAAFFIGLAFLTKISAIFLPFPLAIALLAKNDPWLERIKKFTFFFVSLCVVAPWVIRNQMLYGDPFASQQMLIAVANLVDVKPLNSPYFVTTFPDLLFKSFVGIFGLMNIYLPNWIYSIFTMLFLFAVSGYVLGLINRRISLLVTIILFMIFLLNLFIVIRINLTFTQPQGRYLFPALPAVALIVAIGLENLPRWSNYLTSGFLGGLLALHVYILATLVIPAYWPPLLEYNSYSTVRLQPSSLSNLASADIDDELIVTGDMPIFFKTDISAKEYNFLQFDLKADFDRTDMTGNIYFVVTDDNSVQSTYSIPFDWLADGKVRTITISFLDKPYWRGNVQEISIVPLSEPNKAGFTMKLANIALRGSLDE
jgi:4-amino-4-deoxy-L-arabinose transferase-like glycosyltransferase